MKVFPVIMYTPKFNNGVFDGATKWEHTNFMGWYKNQDDGLELTFDDLTSIIGNHGELCVISLINYKGDEYYEVVPHETDCTAGCEIVGVADFDTCWRYAEGYNTLED